MSSPMREYSSNEQKIQLNPTSNINHNTINSQSTIHTTNINEFNTNSSSISTRKSRLKGCNCRKSSCLKLYCECFGAPQKCGDRCNCWNCKNRGGHEDEVIAAIDLIHRRAVERYGDHIPTQVVEKIDKLRQLPTISTSNSDTEVSTIQPSTLLESNDTLHSSKSSGAARTNALLYAAAAASNDQLDDVWTSQPPKPKNTARKNTGCSCKKSNCLKLYCECLVAQRLCTDLCACISCKNQPNESAREQAIATILERNPHAFHPKVGKLVGSHVRGCHCKRSHCQKRYCECFQAGVECTNRCVCIECKNTSSTNSNNTEPSKLPQQPSIYTSPQPRSNYNQNQSGLEMLSWSAPPVLRVAAAKSHGSEKINHSNDISVSRQGSPAKRKRKLGENSNTSGKRTNRQLFGNMSNDSLERSHIKSTATSHSDIDALELDTITFAQKRNKSAELPKVADILMRMESSESIKNSQQKLCQDLLLAALAVDKESMEVAVTSNNEVGATNRSLRDRVSMERLSIDDENEEAEVDKLYCEEVLNTSVENIDNQNSDYESKDELQSDMEEDQIEMERERAVLQEFSVWLRNLSTPSH